LGGSQGIDSNGRVKLMFKNVAGQFVGVQMVSSADGTAFSGTVTAYVTVDNGTQTIGSVESGVCSHKGNGLHNYAPSQAETNGSSIQFTFIGTGAIPQTIQFETLPTTGVLAPTVANRTIAVSATTGKVTAEAVELDSSARVKLHGTQDDYAPLKASDYTAPLTAAGTRTALGMSTADMDQQLDAILAAASAGAGTGARLVTITVNDGTNVLQNAVVRLTEGSNTYRALTNVSGVATFNVDDATYAVAISKVGYSYAGTTIVVNGVETATYSMSAINVTPGSGDLTTGYLTCLDELGAVEENVSVRCQLVQIPNSGTGFAYDSAVQIGTSGADGVVEFPMIKGARYLVWRGSIKPPQGITPILISASAGSTTALGSLIGD
jgi:hypothetical protein